MRIDEIETRLSAIEEELRSDNCDVAKLGAEVDSLIAERRQIKEAAEQRKNMLDKIAGGQFKEERGINRMDKNKKAITIDSEEYRSAWLKNLSKREMTDADREALAVGRIDKRAMDTSTSSGGYAVPTQTMNKVIEKLAERHPILGEIELLSIPGNVTIPVEITVQDAAIHTENALSTPATDVLDEIALTGYEILKTMRISASLSEMSIAAFETWVVNNLVRMVSKRMAYYAVYGSGSSQPTGINTQTWTDGTNAVDWASTAPTIAEILELIGYLKDSANAKFYMSNATFWTYIATLRDANNPTFYTIENGRKYIMGYAVVIDDIITSGDIFFGNAKEGLIANTSVPISVDSSRESGFLNNSIDFKGWCRFDCAPVAGKFVKSAASL